MTKKRRFIRKLDALSESEKKEAAGFFTKYQNYEKHIDWNNTALRYQDFQKVFSLAKNSSRSRKRKARTDPLLLFGNHNCEIISQTGDFLIVVPLDWECAVFFNSFACGGEGAKWCIGDKDNPKHWNRYAAAKNIFFLVFFVNRHPVFGKKILIRYHVENNTRSVWLQNDKELHDLSGLSGIANEAIELIRNNAEPLLCRICIHNYVPNGLESYSAEELYALIGKCKKKYGFGPRFFDNLMPIVEIIYAKEDDAVRLNQMIDSLKKEFHAL
jgi:hypothetical protein